MENETGSEKTEGQEMGLEETSQEGRVGITRSGTAPESQKLN